VDEKRDEPVLVSRTVCIAIELCMMTLQRRAEVAGMKRAELDLSNKIWITRKIGPRGEPSTSSPSPTVPWLSLRARSSFTTH